MFNHHKHVSSKPWGKLWGKSKKEVVFFEAPSSPLEGFLEQCGVNIHEDTFNPQWTFLRRNSKYTAFKRKTSWIKFKIGRKRFTLYLTHGQVTGDPKQQFRSKTSQHKNRIGNKQQSKGSEANVEVAYLVGKNKKGRNIRQEVAIKKFFPTTDFLQHNQDTPEACSQRTFDHTKGLPLQGVPLLWGPHVNSKGHKTVIQMMDVLPEELPVLVHNDINFAPTALQQKLDCHVPDRQTQLTYKLHLLKQLFQEIYILEKKGLVHPDLKIDNARITQEGRATLTDYSDLSRLDTPLGPASILSTVPYAHPHTIKHNIGIKLTEMGKPTTLSNKTHMWAMAFVVASTLCGENRMYEAADRFIFHQDFDQTFLPPSGCVAEERCNLVRTDPHGSSIQMLRWSYMTPESALTNRAGESVPFANMLASGIYPQHSPNYQLSDLEKGCWHLITDCLGYQNPDFAVQDAIRSINTLLNGFSDTDADAIWSTIHK